MQMHIDDFNFFFILQNLYNSKAQICCEQLNARTLIQILINWLHTFLDWHITFKKNLHNQVTHLFFNHKDLYELLNANPQTFIMDCTYKTNQYKLSLLIINDVTSINTTFYITFAFQMKKMKEDYTFTMNHLKALLILLNLSNPHIILTDCEKALMNSLSTV